MSTTGSIKKITSSQQLALEEQIVEEVHSQVTDILGKLARKDSNLPSDPGNTIFRQFRRLSDCEAFYHPSHKDHQRVFEMLLDTALFNHQDVLNMTFKMLKKISKSLSYANIEKLEQRLRFAFLVNGELTHATRENFTKILYACTGSINNIRYQSKRPQDDFVKFTFDKLKEYFKFSFANNHLRDAGEALIQIAKFTHKAPHLIDDVFDLLEQLSNPDLKGQEFSHSHPLMCTYIAKTLRLFTFTAQIQNNEDYDFKGVRRNRLNRIISALAKHPSEEVRIELADGLGKINQQSDSSDVIDETIEALRSDESVSVCEAAELARNRRLSYKDFISKNDSSLGLQLPTPLD